MSQALFRIVHVVIADGGVACHSVVPDAHGAIIPFDADLQISRNGDVLLLGVLSAFATMRSDDGSYLE